MRHLAEVMLVLEGNQQWAKAVRDGRRSSSRQGGEGLALPLPLPSVSFDDDNGDNMDSDDGVLRQLLKVMVRGVDKELMRIIVSFI